MIKRCDRFLLRLVTHFGIVVALFAVLLGIGMGGYRYFEGMEWIDCTGSIWAKTRASKVSNGGRS